MHAPLEAWRELATKAAANGNTADLALLSEEAPSTAEADWIQSLRGPAAPTQSRAAFLFAGLMVDRPDSQHQRLPPHKVVAAGKAIEHAMDPLGALPRDRAVSGGANGGDLLFAAASYTAA